MRVPPTHSASDGTLSVEEVEGGTEAEPFDLGLAECVVELQCLGCAV